MIFKCPKCNFQCTLDKNDGPKIYCKCGNLYVLSEKQLKSLRGQNQSKSAGLGDTIKKATNAVGIKTCGGCEYRRKLLNRLIPYRKHKKK